MKFTKFLEPLLLLFLGYLFCMAMYQGTRKHNNMVTELTKRQIAGAIISVKYAPKGTLYLHIDDRISKAKLEYYLSRDSFFRDNLLQAGDSIYKDTNSDLMFFYKKNKQEYEYNISEWEDYPVPWFFYLQPILILVCIMGGIWYAFSRYSNIRW